MVGSPPTDKVSQLARRGAAWSAGLIIGQHLVRLAATAILARILLPSDYGLVGMAGVLIVFLQQFSDAGLSLATVQREDLRHEQVHSLFWVNVAIGAMLWAACLAGAPIVAWFFERAELGNIVVVLGAAFLISGFSVQPLALLKRQMRFKSLAILEISTQSAAALVGVVMAIAGFGYWALVGQALAGPVVRTAFGVLVSGYRPRWPGSSEGLFPLVSLGGYLAAYAFVNYFARNLDNILVGKVWGAEALGYYGRAYFLMSLPSLMVTGTLAQVMVPALARFQNDSQRLGEAYRRAVRLIGFVGFPLAGGLAIAAPELIRLVYGPNWAPVVPILFWLAIAGISQPIHNTMGWLFVAKGKGREMFMWGIVASTVLSAAFLWGVRSGPVGVAAAYAIAMTFVLTIPALFVAHKSVGLQLATTLKPLVPLLGSTAIMMAAVYGVGVTAVGRGAGWPVVLCSKVTAGILVYGLLSGLLLREELGDLVTNVKLAWRG